MIASEYDGPLSTARNRGQATRQYPLQAFQSSIIIIENLRYKIWAFTSKTTIDAELKFRFEKYNII